MNVAPHSGSDAEPPPRVSFDSSLGGHLPFSLDAREDRAVRDADAELVEATVHLDDLIARELAEKSAIASARAEQAMARAALEAAITAGVTDDEEAALSEIANAASGRLNAALRESAATGLGAKMRAARERQSAVRAVRDSAFDMAIRCIEVRVLWSMRADIAACVRTAYERAQTAGLTDAIWSSPQQVMGGLLKALISDSVVLPSPSLFNERLDGF